MDVRTANLSYLSMIIQYIGVRFRRFTYALQQANNPSDRLPDDWYQQVQVETHILKQALATCNTYGTIMKVPHVANELLWWHGRTKYGRDRPAGTHHGVECAAGQKRRGETYDPHRSYATYLVDKGPYPSGWEVLQEAKEFFVGVEEGKESLPLLCDMDRMPSDSIGRMIESCDEMIHQEEEEIRRLHGVMEFCSERLTLFDSLGQVQDQLEDFRVNSVTQPGASNK
ncbi:hypothetical protein BKA82DRAFT_4018716 [Pisolithus tinctorius]|nr:hypothetical protein BKA82DRAFT_4018716 [Pisolithus tinctorius]